MNVLIVGCGRFGLALTRLLDETGHQVVVVDPDQAAFDRLGNNFRGRTVTGVGFEREVLLRAGVEQADVLAVVTPDDNVNVVTARIALSRFQVPRVIARLHDPQRANLYRQMGIQFISSVHWGVHRLEHMVTHPGVAGVLSLGSGEVEVVEFHVPAHLRGRPIEQILADDVRLVALTRGGHAQLVTPQTVMEQSDILHLALSRRQRGGQRLETLLKNKTVEVD